MGVLYADRGNLYINSVEAQDVQSITVNFSESTRVVQTMTDNRRAKGWTRGNREITFTFEVAVQNALATPKIEAIDYEANSVGVLFKHGADQYLLKDCFFVSCSQAASGVGTEGRKTFNMGALDIVDLQGDSSLFESTLSKLV